VGAVPTHLFILIKGHVTQTEGDEVLATYVPADRFDGGGLMSGRAGSCCVAAGGVVAYALARGAVTERIAPLFNAAGLATMLPPDIRAVQWGKLLLNLNNPVNALSDLPLRQELLDRDCRRVFAALQTEALRVMARAGITPAQVTAVSPTLLPHVLRLPNWLFTRLAKRMLQIDATARSSMWDDLEAGRVTEIDALSGAVVRLAAQHGIAAPLNARMCELLGGPRQRLTGKQMRQMLGL